MRSSRERAPQSERLEIRRHEELLLNEDEIVRRINAAPNGGLLFHLDPERLLLLVEVCVTADAISEWKRATGEDWPDAAANRTPYDLIVARADEAEPEVTVIELVRKVDGAEVRIKHVGLTFADGYIAIDVGFEASGTCWSTGTTWYQQKLFFTLGANGMLIPRIEPEVPDVKPKVSLRGVCKVGLLVVGTIVSSFATALGALIATQLVVPKMPGKQPPGTQPPEDLPLPVIDSVRWTQVRITPEGMFVQGRVTVERAAAGHTSRSRCPAHRSPSAGRPAP